MRRTLPALAALTAFACSTGFFVQTELSLGDPGETSIDARLVGTWWCTSETSRYRFVIEAAENRIRIEVLQSQTDSKVERSQYKLTAWRTRLGDADYLNMEWAEFFYPLRADRFLGTYRFNEDGRLDVFLMDGPFVVAAIGAKTIGGYTYFHNAPVPVITATRDELIAFVRQHAAKGLFRGKALKLFKAAESAGPC